MGEDGGDRRAYHARTESPLDFVPQRVISLVPSLTESLFDLDLGDRLIAISSNCVRPADRVEYLPQVGGTRDPDIAQIRALRPDFVLMNDQENRREDVDALQAASIPVWVTGPRTVFDVLNLLWALMDVFDHAVMVPRVREIERAYDYSLAASGMSVPVRVFAPIRSDPWMAFTADAYAHDVLCVCGGDNVFGGGESQVSRATDGANSDSERGRGLPADAPGAAGHDRRYLHITLEDVVAAQPEVVLLPDDRYAFSEADAELLASLDIPAAYTRRIHLIDGGLLSWHGTRIAYALRDLPALLMRKVE